MIITIASGKGGTGKTTFAVNLAYALAKRGEPVRLLDCDVEEPNDHLFVKPVFTEEQDVKVLKPVLDADKCDGCGACAKACNYNAIAVVKKKLLIFNELCHSCGVCSYICPQNALSEKETGIGQTQAATDNAPFFFAHGTLNIGEALAPKVVAAVKSYIEPDAVNLLDACPGTACPVVKALEDTDVAVLLTEPTPFGLHDLKIALAMSLEMGVPTGIVINRSDGTDSIIADYAESVGVPVLGRIPFERKYAETYSSGGILAKEYPELAENLLNIYQQIEPLQDAAIPPVPHIEEFAVTAPPHAPFSVGAANSYKEITVISGKGGTGKTTVTAAFAYLAENLILADNDVDAADLHLLLTPRIREATPFVGGTRASINSLKCMGCGRCADACHFKAISLDGPGNDIVAATYRIDPLKCEGCGFCPLVCPVKAVNTEKAVTGNSYISETDRGPMAHARLGIAEENSGRLVALVRAKAALLAEELKAEQILGDGPPGTGCPVIASVSGADIIVVVTEPTVSGVHDMERVMKLADHFGVPAVIIINKADLNKDQADRIDTIAKANGSQVIGRIPFDRAVNDSLMAGKTIVEYGHCKAEKAVRETWSNLTELLRVN